MKDKSTKKFLTRHRLISMCLAIVITVVSSTGIFCYGADKKSEAYTAYYDFLTDEGDNIGEPIRDKDFLNQFYGSERNAIWRDNKILSAYLYDLNGDGIEELIYAKDVIKDGSSTSNRYVCVYSYVNGALKRVGQTGYWAKSSGDGISYQYYQPEGYIGDCKWDSVNGNHPFYICKGSKGISLCDSSLTDLETDNSYRMISKFNGNTMSIAAKLYRFFANNWYINSQLKSQYGKFDYQVNDASVSEATFNSTIKAYSGSQMTALSDNDYKAVLNTIAANVSSNHISHYYTPSQWAETAVSEAISAGYVPAGIQKNYEKNITRGEFCALACNYYEKATGKTVEALSDFTDTTDISIRKMGGIGVVNGVGDGKFAPGKSITRQEAAVMLSRLAASIGTPAPQKAPDYADSDTFASWAVASIGSLQACEIMGGIGGGKFSPLTNYTREQSIVTVSRLGNLIPSDIEIELAEKKINIISGQNYVLECIKTGNGAGAAALKWTSSNDGVASVSADGKVTGISGGTATITVTTPGGKSDSCKVSVEKVDGNFWYAEDNLIKCNFVDKNNNIIKKDAVTVKITNARRDGMFYFYEGVIDSSKIDNTGDYSDQLILNWRLKDANGNILASGKEDLTDLTGLGSIYTPTEGEEFNDCIYAQVRGLSDDQLVILEFY